MVLGARQSEWSTYRQQLLSLRCILTAHAQTFDRDVLSMFHLSSTVTVFGCAYMHLLRAAGEEYVEDYPAVDVEQS
jgi:hypothetical protein